jgi:hypothetical protein
MNLRKGKNGKQNEKFCKWKTTQGNNKKFNKKIDILEEKTNGNLGKENLNK